MEKIIAGLVQMDSGPDMNENMRMAEQYVREAAEPTPYWRLFSLAARFLATIICHISLLSAPRPTYSTATARSIPARN